MSTKNSENLEIEIRIYLENDAEFLAWLENNAEYTGRSDQEDFYFQPKTLPFIYKNDSGIKDADEWLRVRVLGDEAQLCYKKWHRCPDTSASLFADEVEAMVSPKENILKMLKFLGYEQISAVIKTRNSWQYDDFKIEKDHVEGLGIFYEIEYHGKINDPKSDRDFIFRFLEKIGISNWQVIDRGYPWMQWNPHWKKN